MSRKTHRIPAPQSPPLRHTSRPLPAYRHVPGVTPHPVNHPDGHAHGLPEPDLSAAAAALPGGWRGCDDYLFGVDLYNNGYLWEAHEVWEGLWRECPPGSVVRAFLQGLIQVCAALIKTNEGRAAGAERLLAKAGANLGAARAVAGEDGSFMGVAWDTWMERVRDAARGRRADYPFLYLDPSEPPR